METITKSNKTNDSLNKKQRRALKVQEKKDPKQLSEKELRKLEWEKKLAEQKQQVANEATKMELRTKRREQQEAQRLAKTVTEQKKVVEKKRLPVAKRLEFVAHLYSDATFGNSIVNYQNVHPAFVKLGVQYSSKIILGSNARCRALLTALKCLINDLQTPPKQEFCRYLESVLQSCTEHLNKSRPSAVSMNNALRHFKTKLHEIGDVSDHLKKETLLGIVDEYISDEIDKAGESISLKVIEKISNGDVVLTFGCSSLIKRILCDAHSDGKHFQVIVVDGRPFLEGRQMIQRLTRIGINCTYVQMNALHFIMSSATKILLGAHALLTNGYVMSRIGTAQVALVAHAFNKPVLVCCETYKFSEQVLTDSFVYNELGKSDLLLATDGREEKSPLLTYKNNENLQILNLLYDVTPPGLITAVVTELAILPCTSVPVVYFKMTIRINSLWQTGFSQKFIQTANLRLYFGAMTVVISSII